MNESSRHNQIPHAPRLLVLAVCGLFGAHNAYAEESPTATGTTTELETIQVQGSRTTQNLGRERVRRQRLDEQMVQDVRDLVRYDPGIAVVEGGRAGSNGFTIRGVDKDRVAITVDGLEQAESRSSSAFQELFGAYGNFNANRNAAEMENMREVTISKGADSITAGSGALGGAVIYTTKSPRDYVDEEKPYHIGLKTGWFSRSNQWIASGTFAGRLGNADALLVMTTRHGHELKNHSDAPSTQLTAANHNGIDEYRGVARGRPDPQQTENNSTLFRMGYHFTPNNYLSTVFEESREDRETVEYSNLFSKYNQTENRERNDVSYRRRFGIEYENLLENGPWDKLTATFDRQHITMTTMTWDRPTAEKIRDNGVKTENFFRRRTLNHDTVQWKIAAEKYLQLSDDVSWHFSYGISGSRRESGSSNTEEFRKAFFPHLLGADANKQNFLISTRTQNQNLYWNNTLRFGQSLKLNLGLRYDRTNMRTAEKDDLYPNLVNELKLRGLWNQRARFNAPSYAAALDWSPTANLTLQAKYNTAFRAPTSDEMWFAFPNEIFWVEPNPGLQAERAKNMEFGIDLHGGWGNLKLSAFRTRYSNFIDFVNIGTKHIYRYNYSTGTLDRWPIPMTVHQNVNQSRATVSGWELRGNFNLDYLGLPRGTYASLAAAYTKGRYTDQSGVRRPINAIQPFNAVIGLGYRHPENRWGLEANFSYFARKRPEDTVRSFDDPNQVFPFARNSRNFWLADLTGHYQFGRHITLRAGVYNIFNRKYYSWENLRSIREFGTVNRVDNQTHGGINRFSSPGRNFTVMFEAKF